MDQVSYTYQNMIGDLEDCGLNLVAAFDISVLPESITNTLPDRAQEDYSSLLLVGTKGSSFWQHLKSINKTQGDCLDEMSQKITIDIFSTHFANARYLVLYPHSEYVIPLQQLGHLVGWGRPSILGPGINIEYGTWFAYRTAMLVSESLPASEYAQAEEVCEQCIDKPCQTACPVSAVKTLGNFNLKSCIGYRVTDDSNCADKCLARLACPIGMDYFYQPDHLAHHGYFSLRSIKRYIENNK